MEMQPSGAIPAYRTTRLRRLVRKVPEGAEQNIVWRIPNETNGPSYRQHLLDVTHPIYQYVILEFGIR